MFDGPNFTGLIGEKNPHLRFIKPDAVIPPTRFSTAVISTGNLNDTIPDIESCSWGNNQSGFSVRRHDLF